MASQSAVKKPVATPKTELPEAALSGKAPRKPKVFDYARYRQTIHNADDFIRYLAGYPNKSGLCAYVYRLMPRIDLSLIGKDVSNILETTEWEKLTPAAIGQDFGRGRYMITLNDSNRPKGEKEVCKCIYRLDDEVKPAVYDVRTLVLSHADNIDEVNRQIAAGNLVREANGVPRIRTADDEQTVDHANGNGSRSSNGDLFSRETMSQVLLKMIDKGSQNPADAMKQTIEIAKMIAAPAPAPQLSTEQLAELVAAKLERTTRGTNAAGDMFETYERMEGFIKKFRVPGSAAAPAAENGTVAAIRGIVEGLGALVPQVMSGLIQLQQLRAATAVPQRPQARRMPSPPAEEQLPPQASMSVVDRIKEIAVTGFTKMKEGVNGYDFAAWICNFHPGGEEIFRMLDEQGGAPAVMGLAAMDPATANYLTGDQRAHVEKFLTDFFSYDPGPIAGSEMPAAAAGASSAASASAGA